MQENAKKELSAKENSDEQASENNDSAETDTDSSTSKTAGGNGKARIEKIRSYSSDGSEQKIFRTGESIIFKLDYTVKESVEDAIFGYRYF